MLSKPRIPIALRLFLTVLLTTLLITTLSLGVLHWSMQKNFSQYVADVELQKLDHLAENLGSIYAVYNDWGNAIQAHILQIEGNADPDDYDRLSRGWLRRQYDIALQQRYFKEQSMLNQVNNVQDEALKPRPMLSQLELAIVEQNLPSQYQPFEGLRFPLSANRNLWRRLDKESSDAKITDAPPNAQVMPKSPAVLPPADIPENAKKHYISLPDRLGLSNRLALYDSQHRFVVGERAENGSGISFRPIIVNHRLVGYLGLKAVLEQKDALSINFFSQQKRYLLFIYLFSVLASLVASLLLATYFKAPIQRLLHATRVLTRGNYKHQVVIQRNDELGDLSKQLNQLADILYQHEQSRRQWVADTSHELKTPLAVLQAQIEALQDGIRQATPTHLQSMMSQVMSLKKLTQDLSDLAQADAQQLSCYFSEVDPWPLIQQELAHFQPKFAQAELTVLSEGEGCRLQLDADRFRQIIVNLLSNSVRYTLAGGKIHVHSEQTAQYWRVMVDDSPLGLQDDQLARLGERFYRTDDSRARATGGTGLGLALSCKLVQALGGQIHFAHSPLGGLRVQLTFYFNNALSKKEGKV